MIYGQLKNWPVEQQALGPALRQAIEYLRTHDCRQMAAGRYEIDGEKLFALVSEYHTEPAEKRRPERHNRYIDVQYLAEGQELIGCCPFLEKFQETENLLGEKDIVFYREVEEELMLSFSAGVYAVFFPTDVHRPCCAKGQPSQVKKVVIKVSVDLLR